MKKVLLFVLLVFINRANAQSLLWANGFGGLGTQYSGASITHDKQGNCIVTGELDGTIDFDPGTNTANLTALGQGDIFLAKYDANGNYVWAFNIGSSGNQSLGWSVTADNNDNIIVTGFFQGTCDFNPGPSVNNLTFIGQQDAFIAKYSPTGFYMWAFNMGSPGGSAVGNSITTDANGNVFVTGDFAGLTDFNPSTSINNLSSNGVIDVFIAKYDGLGNYLWAFNIGGFGGGSGAHGYSVATDPTGNIFVTGQFNGTADFNPGAITTNITPSSGNIDGFLAKYDNNGNYLFAHRLESNIAGAIGYSVSVDLIGNTSVMGVFYGTMDFNFGPGIDTLHALDSGTGIGDIYVAKYDNNGNYIWALNIGSYDYNNSVTGTSITNDKNGNLFMTGYFNGTIDFNPGISGDSLSTNPLNSYNMFLAKYDVNGNYVWAFNVGANNYGASASSVSADTTGNVWVIGGFTGTNVDFDPSPVTYYLNAPVSGHDVSIAKYNSTLFVSVKENIFDNIINIYPNPTNNTFILETNAKGKIILQIYDLVGKEVRFENLDLNNKTKIDISNLPDGIYNVRVSNNEGAVNKKLVVVR